MTLENINDRSHQSSRINNYMLDNPSNHTRDINTCYTQPGLTCRSLHVKTSGGVVDNETLLLRGVHSTAAEPYREQSPELQVESIDDSEAFAKNRWFMGEMSRLSKACNEEHDFTSRLQNTHTPISTLTYPLINTDAQFGENTRNTAKYGG